MADEKLDPIRLSGWDFATWRAASEDPIMRSTMIGLIIMHVYAAIWTRGTIRAMLYGTVTRAWAPTV